MKKRLFISTGFYSTLLAASIAESSLSAGYENHLLITIDRQSSFQNLLWANRLFNYWQSADVIDHANYYIGSIQYNHDVTHFDEVYSPFPIMKSAVAEAFSSSKYFYYEEGLTSYRHFFDNLHCDNDVFYSLHPYLFNNFPNLLSLPLSVNMVKEKLSLAAQCYQLPSLSGYNNVVLIATGGFPDELQNIAMRNECIEVVGQLSEQGYNVYIHEHPRVSDEFLKEELKSNPTINVNFISTDAPLADLFLLKNKDNIMFIAGVCSTLLINSSLLLDIKSYAMKADFLDDRQSGLRNIQSLIIPNLSERPT